MALGRLSFMHKSCCFLLLLVTLAVLIETSNGLPTEIERILRRAKRQSSPGGFDANRQDLGFGKGYGYGGFDEYCQDCTHCNGCGHAPNRRELIEYDYTPK
ncbi:unnamed protein product [Allacma fusca]|uniref:Uncharacterized protein n=1 Tax=Allacma fusca TaxID=39272 RepID=A0A8J2JUN1_9HEXA|nr:unnamed protein product [Allacma fusca]